MNASTRNASEGCHTCLNKGTADLCNLEGPAASEFERIRHTLVYKPGQFVFYEGHTVLGLYVLCSGRLKLTRSTARGQRRLVGFADPGMLVEKQAFRDGAIHEVTCEALEPSQVCVIDRGRFLSLLEANGEVAVRLIKLLSREMGTSFDEVDQFAFASTRERLAKLLLELADRYGENSGAGRRITLRLKREEIAQMIAATVETTVRTLRSFHESELIHMRGRELTILQPDRLRRAARTAASSDTPT